MSLYERFKDPEPDLSEWSKAVGTIECPVCTEPTDESYYNNETGVLLVACEDHETEVFIGKGRND